MPFAIMAIQAQHRACVYEGALQYHPRRRCHRARCWRQQVVVWIKPPPSGNGVAPATLEMAA